MVVQRLIGPGSKLSVTRRFHQTTLADGVKGKLQVNYGLTCSPEGRPVAVEVHDGSTQDQKTLPAAVGAVRERFQIEHVVVVGDRGMITQAHAQSLKDQGVDFISALKAPQIRALDILRRPPAPFRPP